MTFNLIEDFEIYLMLYWIQIIVLCIPESLTELLSLLVRKYGSDMYSYSFRISEIAGYDVSECMNVRVSRGVHA